MAGGPANWNQQQGFYVYRSDRLIQSGGWCRIRTLDEHTKLARVALRFSSHLDDAFRVNVSKMRVQLPAGMRERIADAISPVTRLANDVYRRTARDPRNGGSIPPLTLQARKGGKTVSEPSSLVAKHAAVRSVIDALLRAANRSEQTVIRRVAARLKGS
jgi:hypothetical protein